MCGFGDVIRKLACRSAKLSIASFVGQPCNAGHCKWVLATDKLAFLHSSLVLSIRTTRL